MLIARTTIALALFAALGTTHGAAAEPTIGQPAPDFAATDRDGNKVEISSLRGKNVVLVFTRAHW